MSVERDREPSQERERSQPTTAPSEEFKIFVGGISWHMDDRELKDTFKKFGATDARVMLDRISQRSRGFGFVHFANKEDLEEAVEKMHEAELDGRKISVTRAIPQDSIQPGTPAAAIGRRGDRGPERRPDRYERYPPRGYDRYPPRAYERAPYDRYPDYDRGYDRGYGGGYERDYPRDPYSRADPYADRYGYGSDPYDRDPYYASYGRSRDPYEARTGGFPDRYEPDRRGGAGYDRYSRAGGPDRDYGRYASGSSSRAGPYERAGIAGRLP